MSDDAIEQFRAAVEERFRFLEAHGFRRSRADEHDSPVGASVAYAGKHIGFLVSCDLRDGLVDVRVVRVRNRRLIETGEGGYSRNLLSHLVEHAGYRGGLDRAGRGRARTASGPWERMVDSWAELLRDEGGTLLADEAQAIPMA
jgi:hypothetical protein